MGVEPSAQPLHAQLYQRPDSRQARQRLNAGIGAQYSTCGETWASIRHFQAVRQRQLIQSGGVTCVPLAGMLGWG